ncbi:MAG: biotin transporter BioY, partial [Coriobacteriales bacterium]|nr:biotin transporter BioY [Coriobacteriales bacterium]
MAARSKTQSLALTGLSIALISVGALIAVPFGPVPFTLQSLVVGLVICLLPPAYSVAAVGGYLALGCLGLPVFSGMRGGIAVLAGPTGGFLIGFLLAAVIIAFIRSRVLRSKRVEVQKTTQTKKSPQTDTHTHTHTHTRTHTHEHTPMHTHTHEH